MKTRVRVKRADLIKVVDGRLRRAENEHKRAVAAYPAALARWEKDAVVQLEKALAAAKRGKMPKPGYGIGVRLPAKPDKPSEGRATCNLRRMLATLRMGSEDSLLLSQDDADEYFGPCEK